MVSKRHGGNNDHHHNPSDPLGNRPKLVVPEGTNQLEISDEAKTQIKGLDQLVAQSKFNLGNIEYQITQLLKQRDEAIAGIDKAQKMFTAGVLATAKQLGISTDDPTKGKWNFDATTMVFTKTG